MRTGIALLITAGLGLPLTGCAGPCETVRAERQALAAQTAFTAEPPGRFRLPFALANRLIADALAPPADHGEAAKPLSAPVPLDRLGPLAALIGEVRAVPREVVLGPAPPGRVHVDVR